MGMPVLVPGSNPARGGLYGGIYEFDGIVVIIGYLFIYFLNINVPERDSNLGPRRAFPFEREHATP